MRSKRFFCLVMLLLGVSYGLRAQGLTNTAFSYKRTGDTIITFTSIKFSENGTEVPANQLNVYIVFINVSAGQRKANTQSQVIAGIDGNGRALGQSQKIQILKKPHLLYSHSGLETATRYKVQVVAVKPNEPGTQDDVRSGIVEGDFETMDTRPPRLTLGSLGSRSVTGESVSFRVNLNENGKVYYIVLPAGSEAPTAEQIKAGTGAQGTAPIPVEVTRYQNYDPTAGGLDNGVSYVLYVVGEDRSGNFSEVSREVAFTTVDTTPPEASLTLGTPTARSISLSLQSNEDANYYVVVWKEQETTQDDAATYNTSGNDNGIYARVVLGQRNTYYLPDIDAPDANEIDADFYETGEIAAGQTVTLVARGLQPEKKYRAHAVIRDGARNTAGKHKAEGVLSSEAFTTPSDAQAPTVSAELKSATSDKAVVSLSSSEPATLYYLLLGEGEAAPDADAIKTPDEGTTSGTQALTQDPVDVTFSDLSPDTGYKLYVVAVDLAGLSSTVFDFSFRTQDNVLPSFSTLEVEELSASTLKLSVRASEPATAYYVIVGESAPVPSKDEVSRRKGAQDTDPRQSGEVSVGPNEGVISVAGLSKDEYLLYVVLKDRADNMSGLRVKFFDTGALVAGGSEKFSVKKTVEMQVQTTRQRMEASTLFVENPEQVLVLYPNPAQQRLYIQSTEPMEKLVLHDAAGKSVLERTFGYDEEAGRQDVYEKHVSTRGLPEGSYFLTATLLDGTRITRRFAKE